MSGEHAETSHPPVRASIVIVNYNGGAGLIRCLDSVVGSLPADAEVILVDNASSDGSAEEAAVRFRCPTLLRSPTNRGFGAASNLGAARARGRYLVFLNPDTLVEPGWLEELVATVEDHPGFRLVTAQIVQVHRPDRVSACGNAVHISGLTLSRGKGAPREEFRQVEEVDAVSGAAFAIRRDLFDALGGFDEDFFLYVEDTDLSWRARLLGARCLYEPKSVVFHDYAFRLTPLKIFHQERNRYLMLLKCLRWPTLLALIPAVLLAELVAWGFVMLRDRRNAGKKIRAYGWVISNWKSIIRKRRAVQASRRASDRSLLRTTGHRLDFGQVASPRLARAAQLVFDPLFLLCRGFALAVVWW